MTENDRKGMQDAARFAMQPNMWGFCGDKKDQSILRRCVVTPEFNYQEVRNTLSGHGFPHLNAFLEAISKATDKDLFSDEVVKAYWFGSKLTEESVDTGRKFLIEQYKQRMGSNFGEAVDKILLPKIPLTHLTQVAMIAAADYGEPQRSEVINLCMIAGAKIEKIDLVNKTVLVNRDIVEKQENGYKVAAKAVRVKLDLELTPDLKIGDNVAVHLGFLAGKLNKGEAEQLNYWTKRVVDLI